MSAKTGIRKIEDIDGGVIAWLYPGGADLDDVLLAIARYDECSRDEWWEMTGHRTEGPEPAKPEAPWTDESADAWRYYCDHCPPYIASLDEEFPTHFAYVSGEILDVGYYRRMPWCHCGEDHGWHYEPSRPGRGASLAVVVGGAS